MKDTVERVRAAILSEIRRRRRAHKKLIGDSYLDLGDRFASSGEAYRAALDDLEGWLDGADRSELIGRR